MLTTVSGIKTFGDISMDDTSLDDLLNTLIQRVSALIETYTDRVFEVAEYTEYIYDNSGKYLFPKQYPITTVSGVWVDIDWQWDDTTLVDSFNYRVVNGNSILFKDDYPEGDVKIIYSAGYEVTPYEVEQACIEEVLHRFKSRTQVDITSKTLDDGTAVFTERNMLPQVTQALKKYKRKDVI